MKTKKQKNKPVCTGRKSKKHLGQNFLVDEGIIKKMIEVAEINKGDVVIEVGAGTGNLTRLIGEKAGQVIAFEIDKDLIPVLRKNLQSFLNIEIVNEDILKCDFEKMGSGYRVVGGEYGKSEYKKNGKVIFDVQYTIPYTILGSIPYSITSPLIHKILFSDLIPKSIVFLIQWEVAEKICSQPPKASYLSNLIASCGKAQIVQKVTSSAFSPQPKVDSAIVTIEKFKRCDQKFGDFLHQGFMYPRKMMRKKFDESLLKKVGIDSKARAQELGIGDWEKLFKINRVYPYKQLNRGFSEFSQK